MFDLIHDFIHSRNVQYIDFNGPMSTISITVNRKRILDSISRICAICNQSLDMYEAFKCEKFDLENIKLKEDKYGTFGIRLQMFEVVNC